MTESKATKISEVNVGTENLCFDKTEFMKENFSVDEFLHKNRNVPSLELLRDNLGLYLKGLRASMIDLINEDYADFVSLSANLVGLDHNISNIQKPLEQFQDEIESINSTIEENVNEIKIHLERKRQLREAKRNLESLKKVYNVQTKIEALLENQLKGSVSAVDVERAALELIQLKFNEKFCSEYLKEGQKEKNENLGSKVLEKLRLLFNESLKNANSTRLTDDLERALRIYVTLDSCHVAESVFRKDVVAPYMSATISEHCLQNSPQGLSGVYSKVLNFISLHMTDLLRLTLYTDKVTGFNFLINSFWTDVEMRLETHMTSIFAPGNSEVFFSKYMCTRNFLQKIEELLAGEQAVQEFRQHKQTRSFQTKWNLPVYFQICFQEIAGQYENCLEPLLHNESVGQNLPEKEINHNFKMSVFKNAVKATERCWSDGIYLSEIFPKFFKLHIQIILRLSRWIEDVISLVLKKNIPNSFNNVQILVALYSDIERLMEILTKQQIQIYNNHIPKEKQIKVVEESIKKSFRDLTDNFEKHCQSIQEHLIEILSVEGGSDTIKQVNDIPRLYRKTNREIPTKCSVYVEQMLKPLKAFVEQESEVLGHQVVRPVMEKVFQHLTTDYYHAVMDVLTSVQKTEESLRRLRTLKTGNSGFTLASNSSNTTSVMSDDDKIRLQLRVDVSTWTKELAKLGFMPTQIDNLLELNNIVDESIKFKETSSVS